MRKPSAAQAVVNELLSQFPDAPALTLAKRAYRDHAALWPNLEACRSMFRGQLGVNGKHNRKSTNTTHHRPKRTPGDWRKTIPPALNHFDTPWGPAIFAGPLRALVLADVHIPYHDEAALQAAIEYGLKERANFVLLNGDVQDFFALSRWEKDPRKRDFPAEVRAGRAFLQSLRKAFSKARLVLKEGNHEERFESYLRMKAPELLGLPDFTWQAAFDLDSFGVTRVADKRPIRLGSLNVIHGHEYRFAISNPVNPARGFFLRGQAHCLGGHFHQTSQHSAKNLEQSVTSCWSTGCLCHLHPDYAPLNNWNHGFAFVAIDKGGAFRVENLRIIDGKVW